MTMNQQPVNHQYHDDSSRETQRPDSWGHESGIGPEYPSRYSLVAYCWTTCLILSVATMILLIGTGATGCESQAIRDKYYNQGWNDCVLAYIDEVRRQELRYQAVHNTSDILLGVAHTFQNEAEKCDHEECAEILNKYAGYL